MTVKEQIDSLLADGLISVQKHAAIQLNLIAEKLDWMEDKETLEWIITILSHYHPHLSYDRITEGYSILKKYGYTAIDCGLTKEEK